MNRPAAVAIIVVIIALAAVVGIYSARPMGPNSTGITSSSTINTTSPVPTPTATTTAAPTSIKDRIVVALKQEPGTLDPMLGGGSTVADVSEYIFEPLVAIRYAGNQSQVVPVLATSYSQVNTTVWDFKLRQGVKFQDGTPFNATAVKIHFDVLLNPNNTRLSGVRASLPTGFRVQVVDLYTVRFRTTQPWALIINVISGPYVGLIKSPSSYVKYGTDIVTNPVGTGPYTLQQWSKGVNIVLHRWDSYWGDKPKTPYLEFRWIQDDNARVLALESGSVDYITDVPPLLTQDLAQRGFGLQTVPSLYTIMIWIDASQPPLSNKLVRQAMNYAVDTKSIVNSILRGGGTVADNGVSPSTFGYTKPTNYFNYDPGKAKTLLAQAGYANGVRVTLYSTGRYLLDSQVSQAVAGYLNAVGIQTDVQNIDFQTLIAKLRAGVRNVSQGVPGTLSLLGQSSNGDADVIYYNIWDSKSVQNYWHYSDSQYDKLVEEARFTLDPQQRLQLYKQALSILIDNPPAIFLYWQNVVAAYNPHLRGAEAWPDQTYWFTNAIIPQS